MVCYEKNEKPTNNDDVKKAVSKQCNCTLDSFGLADPLKVTGWKDDITTWPTVDHILEKKAFEADYVGQYMVKKAYSYIKSGFVAQILSLVPADGGKKEILLMSGVLPSQKISSPEHTVWVLVDKCGDIVTAY